MASRQRDFWGWTCFLTGSWKMRREIGLEKWEQQGEALRFEMVIYILPPSTKG